MDTVVKEYYPDVDLSEFHHAPSDVLRGDQIDVASSPLYHPSEGDVLRGLLGGRED